MKMDKRGFTLLEVLIVIVILGILASLAMPRYFKATGRAYQAEAWANIVTIRGAMQRYYAEYGNYSTSEFTYLDVEDSGDLPGANFTYDITGSSTSYTIVATGITTKPAIANKWCRIAEDIPAGTVTKSQSDDW